MQSRYPIWLTLGLCLCLSLGSNAVAQDHGDYRVKASFIGKVLHFIQWPAERLTPTNAPIVVGVLGKDPFGEVLDEVLRGTRIQGRSVVIQRFDSFKQALSCHLLFCAETNRLDAAMFRQLNDQCVFLMSDQAGFAAKGGALEFYHGESTVCFRINPDTLKRSRLKVSSKLLRLGRPIAKGGT
jgi:hypothetical protein